MLKVKQVYSILEDLMQGGKYYSLGCMVSRFNINASVY